jgi:hypothetical protein
VSVKKIWCTEIQRVVCWNRKGFMEFNLLLEIRKFFLCLLLNCFYLIILVFTSL